MAANPYFSIVIPAYNREREVGRALNSCLRQSYPHFEVLVVDDGSLDRTSHTAVSSGDERVRLIVHERNRGVCAARNSGVRHALGEWILFLDSDDEYESGALGVMRQRTLECRDVDRLGFMYRLDDGGFSPCPPCTGQLLDYEGYLRWSTEVSASDFHNCVRRRTFEDVMLPEGRVYEDLYHLDFARRFRTKLYADVVAVIHSDSANRTQNLSAGARATKYLTEAADGARGVEEILGRHGPAIRKIAPARYEAYCRMRVTYSFLSGDLAAAMRLSFRQVVQFPFRPRSWLIPAIGLAGPYALARAQSFASGRRHAKIERLRT